MDVGCPAQVRLHRTSADIRRLSEAGASLRLCKRAYAEPAHVAHQPTADVDGSFLRCATWLYRLRIYVPFGDQWYAYFLRRLAERPANLLFLLRALRS